MPTEAYGILWGHFSTDQWLAESIRVHGSPSASLFSLRNGFTAYSVLSPENGSFASVAPWKLLPPDALTPAPRRQDHTSSPYASAPFVTGASASTASPSHGRDDRERPSERDGMAIDMPLFSIRIKRNIFDFGA